MNNWPTRCPRCHSPSSELHPAMQWEGEVQPCPHPFHGPLSPLATDDNNPAVIRRAEHLRRISEQTPTERD